MKTLKLFFILLISVGIINNAKAQSSFYLRAGAGIGFGLNPSVIGTDVTTTSTPTSYSSTASTDKHSPGEGIYPEIAVGYMVNDNIGFELGFSYAIGFSTTVTNSGTSDSSGFTETTNSATKYSFHSFLITPAFVLKGSSDNTLSPYARMGLIISVASQIDADNTSSDDITGTGFSSSNSGVMDYQTSGTVQLGVAAAVGVTCKLSDNISLFGEVNARAFNFNASQTTLTTYTVNGANQLTGATTSQTQTNYVSSITTTNTTTYSPGSPSQALTMVRAASSVGISIGIKIGFGGK